MTAAVNCWTPGRVVDHIRRGWVVPEDWRQILRDGRFYGWSEIGLPVLWEPLDGVEVTVQGSLDFGGGA